ncbi:aldo/keto reductase [Kitasatospora sp. KL5]|uniref:aldo/keto reductase n=1 Tax=Kitasatospora sp. KL5 TaxID=3425125 RepID=UPI003D7001A7
MHRPDTGESLEYTGDGTGVIVYSPLQSGLLTGAFTAQRAAGLGADDWRSAHADFTTGLAANLALAEALRPIAVRHGATVAEIAIAWALARPGITGAIVGARRPEQVDGWRGAGSVGLAPADLEGIAAAITATGAGTGPARPRVQPQHAPDASRCCGRCGTVRAGAAVASARTAVGGGTGQPRRADTSRPGRRRAAGSAV